MLTKELVEFGLSEKEAVAYIKLLELEVAGVQELAKYANLNRSSTYVVLESLKKRGLVSISDDKKVRKYIATPPEALLRAAQDQTRHQQNILKKIEAIVPDMKALYQGTKKKPVVKVFEGKEGLVSAFEDTLISKEKLMRVSSSVGTLMQILPDYFPEYVKSRFNSKIKMKGIHPFDEPIKNLIKFSPKNFDQIALIPRNKFMFPADLAIYDNKIAYMSPNNGGIAIIIESNEVSSVMKIMFDLAFEEAKRLDQQIKLSAKLP